MLPSFLYPSYKQYKADSDAVATWLATTATRFNYSKDLLKRTLRPKGSNYTIAIKDFVPLAEWIVESTKSRIEVPQSFIGALDRAITVRKRHNDWWYRHYDKHTNNAEGIATETHGYFIHVLEKVQQIFKPLVPVKSQPAGPARDGSNVDAIHEPMINLFENLTIEEPSDVFVNPRPAVEKQSNTVPSPIHFIVDRDQSHEELHLALHCLFNDFNTFRAYLKQVWRGYKLRSFDLLAVSITTDTAMEFATRLEEDLLETFPRHTDMEEHINAFYKRLCSAANQDPHFREQMDDDINFAVYEEAESMFFPSYKLMSSFADTISRGVQYLLAPERYGNYNPSSIRAIKAPREKFLEDKVILATVLPDFCTLARGHEAPLAEDEITRGVRKMMTQSKPSLSLAFSVQTFLDIHHSLREEINRGFQDLNQGADFAYKSLNDALDFQKSLRHPNWSPSDDTRITRILSQILKWITRDAAETARMKAARPNSNPTPGGPHTLLKNHPLYCGLLLYSIKSQAQEVGIAFCDSWGAVLYCAHLYNALRQEGLLLEAWKDMDLVLLMHRAESISVGDFPQTKDDYFKRLALAVGYSPAMFAKNKRRAGPVASKAGPRKLNALSPVAAMFKARYSDCKCRTNLTPSDVDTILRLYSSADNDIVSKGLRDQAISKYEINLLKNTATPDEGLDVAELSNTRQKFAANGVPPVQLLNTLLNAIQSEIIELSFDHFRLHIYCWHLISSVFGSVHADIGELFGDMYIPDQFLIPHVVAFIFMAMVPREKIADLIYPSMRQNMEVTDRFLVKTMEIMQQFIDSDTGEGNIRLMRLGLGISVESVPDFFQLPGQPDSQHTRDAIEGPTIKRLLAWKRIPYLVLTEEQKTAYQAASTFSEEERYEVYLKTLASQGTTDEAIRAAAYNNAIKRGEKDVVADAAITCENATIAQH